MSARRRIIIDARKLGDGGIGVYLENLLLGLAELSLQAGFELSALVEPERLRRADLPGEARDISAIIGRLSGQIDWIGEPAGKYSASEYLVGFKRRRLLRNAALYHSPHYTLPFIGPFSRGTAQVVTVHDAIHVTHPDSLLHKVAGRLLIRSALKRADRVITVSEESKRALGRVAPPAERKICVIPNALREGVTRRGEAEVQSALQALELRRGALVFVGSDRPHKGFRRMIAAWRLLPLDLRPEIVAIGTRFEEVRREFEADSELQARLHFVATLDTRTLSALYSSARAVVVPSTVEGFGLPALEALACGTPVVCTPLPSVREVAGDAAWYAADFSEEALRRTLEEFLRIPEDASELSRRRKAGLLRAEEYSIKAVAERTIEVYEQCLRGQG